ncbi:hypothetical protein TrVE_jg1201 [Triparma verrucosa]|uniref:Uncharacterized protein n=1 Tax=Triparma verrucosa TaxID=1606542 RepID=A0A9W7F246_9STRA|nr:hypothetical protein TrVE_jg1201 [Triparma verrucosa]
MQKLSSVHNPHRGRLGDKEKFNPSQELRHLNASISNRIRNLLSHQRTVTQTVTSLGYFINDINAIKVVNPPAGVGEMNTLCEQEVELSESLKLISSLSSIPVLSLSSSKTFEAWEAQFLLILNLESTIPNLRSSVDPEQLDSACATLSAIKATLVSSLTNCLEEMEKTPPHLLSLSSSSYFKHPLLSSTYSDFLRASLTDRWITYLTPPTSTIESLLTRLTVYSIDPLPPSLSSLRLTALSSVVSSTLTLHPPSTLSLPELISLLTLLPPELKSQITSVKLAFITLVKPSLDTSLKTCLDKRQTTTHRGIIVTTLQADVILTVKSYLGIREGCEELKGVVMSSLQNVVGRMEGVEDYVEAVGDVYAVSELVEGLEVVGVGEVGECLMGRAEVGLEDVVGRPYGDLEVEGVEFFGNKWFDDRENFLSKILVSTVADYTVELESLLSSSPWLLRRSSLFHNSKLISYILTQLTTVSQTLTFHLKNVSTANLKHALLKHKRRMSQSIQRRASTIIGEVEINDEEEDDEPRPWDDRIRARRIFDSDLRVFKTHFEGWRFEVLEVLSKLIDGRDFEDAVKFDSYVSEGGLGFDGVTLKVFEALKVLGGRDFDEVLEEERRIVKIGKWQVIEEGKNEGLRRFLNI